MKGREERKSYLLACNETKEIEKPNNMFGRRLKSITGANDTHNPATSMNNSFFIFLSSSEDGTQLMRRMYQQP